MKLIGKILLGVVALCIVVFALANRQTVTLSLWPLPVEILLPRYVAVLGGVVAGLLLGGAMMWLPRWRLRRRVRTSERRADRLEQAAETAAPAPTVAPLRLPTAPNRALLDDD